jgi:hypothetical protein
LAFFAALPSLPTPHRQVSFVMEAIINLNATL